MSLKQRVGRLEERLDLSSERVQMVLFYQCLPDDMEWVPEPFQPGHNLFGVSRLFWVVFTGGTETQKRAALDRLRRDPRYQQDPCANRPTPALTGEQDARAGKVLGKGESPSLGRPEREGNA